jgi:serine/threonine-protein kinase
MSSCPVCQAGLDRPQRFCPACGAALDPSASPTFTRHSPSPTPPARSPQRAELESGELLAGRYRIASLLGRGGMGEVYRADDLKLEQPVALKLLPRAFAQDQQRVNRFLGEVRLARQVSHPSVCRVYDVGEADGRHFLSMELIDGEDLGTLLRRIGRMSPDKGLEMARQLCAGLAAAHDRGVVHGDLKPSNVMIDGRGRVRVADFGLASLAGDDPSAGGGTPGYMAPELFAGASHGVKTDIYALGLVLYELFTGKAAFKGNTALELARAHREIQPAGLTDLAPGLEPEVERVILRCLDKEPARRPASALAVAAALPGGDPLAAALALGETPSPEVVAAAGAEGRVTPRLGWAGLAATAILFVAVVQLSASTQMARIVPLAKGPEVLAERAREILRTLGYAESPRDEAWGFTRSDYVQYIRDTDRSPRRWERLKDEQLTGLLFWYRRSPRHLATYQFGLGGRVLPYEPQLSVSGMVTVLLDPSGRLEHLAAVPDQLDDRPAPPAFDLQALLPAAGFDPVRFSPTPSRWVPPVYADVRAAWDGVYPSQPDVAVHVEAAAARGRPVYFQIFEPWTRPTRMEERARSVGERLAGFIVPLLVMAAIAGAALLARRNVRRGRGDRRGAVRVSVAALLLDLVAGLLAASHVPDAAGEMGVLLLILAQSALKAGGIALLYLALEPDLRRHWPVALITWSRVVAGRLRDPLVGRDVLVGVVCGVALQLLRQLGFVAARLAGSPPFVPDVSEFPLGGFRFAVSLLLGLPVAVLVGSLVNLLLLFFFYRLLRPHWLAGGSVVAVMTAISLSQSTALIDVVYVSLFSLGVVLILLRFGLFAAVVSGFCGIQLSQLPLTFELSAWYVDRTLLALAAVGSLALYGFRVAVAGQPLLGGFLRD